MNRITKHLSGLVAAAALLGSASSALATCPENSGFVSLSVTPSKTIVTVGETIRYCYAIKNVSGLTLNFFAIFDDNGTPGNAGDDFYLPIGQILPGETINVCRDSVVPQTTSCLTSSATVFGGIPNTSLSTCAAASATICVQASGAGTGTPGYWKNHASAWCTPNIVLGSVTYTKAQAIAIMQKPTKGDKTFNLAEHLIAAKLNVGCSGTNPDCVAQAIADADAFLALFPIGSKVAASSPAWTAIAPTFNTLAAYNEGKLCAPHRD